MKKFSVLYPPLGLFFLLCFVFFQFRWYTNAAIVTILLFDLLCKLNFKGKKFLPGLGGTIMQILESQHLADILMV